MSDFLKTSSQDYQKALAWVENARALAPHVCDWIGIYYKESFVTSELASSTDLVLGAFIGEATEHTRIPLSKGICGLALREERTVNVADVRSHSEHIACSIKTRSELVIPLKDKSGRFVAELDIDSNNLNAFTPELEAQFKKFAETFVNLF